jgi:hypothetical protein
MGIHSLSFFPAEAPEEPLQSAWIPAIKTKELFPVSCLAWGLRRHKWSWLLEGLQITDDKCRLNKKRTDQQASRERANGRIRQRRINSARGAVRGFFIIRLERLRSELHRINARIRQFDGRLVRGAGAGIRAGIDVCWVKSGHEGIRLLSEQRWFLPFHLIESISILFYKFPLDFQSAEKKKSLPKVTQTKLNVTKTTDKTKRKWSSNELFL